MLSLLFRIVLLIKSFHPPFLLPTFCIISEERRTFLLGGTIQREPIGSKPKGICSYVYVLLKSFLGSKSWSPWQCRCPSLSRRPRHRGLPRPCPRPPRGPWAGWRWTWCSSRCWSPWEILARVLALLYTACYLGGNGPGVAVALHDTGDAVPVTNPVEGRDQDAAAHEQESRDPVVEHRHQALGHWGPLLLGEYHENSEL